MAGLARAYPVAWRDGAAARLPRPTPNIGRPGNIVRFPGARPQALQFGPPTRLPGRSEFGLRPIAPAEVPAPLELDPFWIERRMPWVVAGLILLDLTLPTGARNFPVAPSNWTHVCGPFAYPGPPYRNTVNWTFNGASSVGTCLVPLGGQSLTINNSYLLPPFGDPAHTLIYAYGPNEALLPVERWYTYDQYSVAAGPVSPLPTLQMLGVAPLGVPMYVSPLVAPGVFVNLLPLAPPIGRADPRFSERGDVDGYADPRSDPGRGVHPNSNPGLRVEPEIAEQRPRVRERERKVGGRAAAGFRFLSQVGTWNSLANAMWHALPKSKRTRHANSVQKIRDIWRNWRSLDLGAAAYYGSLFWVRYRLAGAAYGRIQHQLLEMDPSGRLLRNLYTALDHMETFRLEEDFRRHAYSHHGHRGG